MEHGYFNSKNTRLLGSLVLVMVIVALAAYAKLTFEQSKESIMPATISVDGTGEVTAIPDIGEFSFSVEAEAADATAAQEVSGTKINEIIAYLKEKGVAEEDTKTTNYNLYPKYSYEQRVCAIGSWCPPGEQVQDGFTVSQTITVKVRDTNLAPELIAGVGERGATNISGLAFTIDDTEALKIEARDKAIVDAKAKAEKLAESLGVKLTRIVSYYENTPGYYGDSYAKEATMAFDAEEGFGGAMLPVGENTTTVSVNLVYEIK